MADQGFYQTQTQKLAIGPQMQQSLQFLQAPTLELRQIIQQEVEINPVLELESPEVSLEDTAPEDPADRDELDVLSQMDEEWREYWAQSRMQSNNRRSDDQERWQYLMDSIVAPTTLPICGRSASPRVPRDCSTGVIRWFSMSSRTLDSAGLAAS